MVRDLAQGNRQRLGGYQGQDRQPGQGRGLGLRDDAVPPVGHGTRMVRHFLAGALASALIASCPTAQAEPIAPADATEIVETLLGIAPQRHANPLAAMHGWGALYARTREAALTGDEGARRTWFLIAFAAQVRGDAALNQSFADDLYPAYHANPEGFLTSLAAAPWLAASVCDRLGAHFGSSDRPQAGVGVFTARAAERFRTALPAKPAEACIAALASD